MTRGNPAPTPQAARRPDWAGLAAGAVLAAGTVLIYARTFSVPPLLDDRSWLLDNPSLHPLGNLRAVLSPRPDTGVGGRPFLNLTYALNFAAGGDRVAGYHAVNLLIHVFAAWTLFALVRQTLLLPAMAARFGRAATPLALTVGAIWAWHPVQTEAVTYLAQRSESLMGLCYLLTLFCFLRGAIADRPGRRGAWFCLALLACLAGVGSKEVIVTAPLLVFLYDRTFISGSFSAAWRRHWAVHLALAATWLPLGLLAAGLRQRGVGFGSSVTWWAYGLVESRVVVKYLLLTLWPRPLIFDYGAFAPAHLAQVWPYILAIAALLAGTAVAVRRAPASGFAACWFFLILAPTSTIIPVVAQPMAESRLYLPLAGVAAFTVLGGYALAGKRSLAVFATLAVCLGLAAATRNRDYRSEEAIWADALAKLPGNSRGHSSLASALEKEPGRLDEAVAEYAIAARLAPDDPKAQFDLGYAYVRAGRVPEAIAQYEKALRLRPGYAEAHERIGNIWYGTPGRMADAVAEYQMAIRLQPAIPGAHNDLGNAWYSTPGHMAEAIAEYRKALRLDPNFPEAHNNLGNALLNEPGQLPDAIAQYETATRLKPDYADARLGLAIALLRLPGRQAEARAQLTAFLQLKPNDATARQLLDRITSASP